MGSTDTEVKKSFGRRVINTLFFIKNSDHTARTLESVSAMKHAPGLRYVLMRGKQLSASCRAGIFDTKAKTWALRFDNAHRGVNKPHININYKLTGVRDPHIKVPGSVVASGEAISKAAQGVATLAFIAALCNDSYRVGKSWYEDYKESNSYVPGKNVTKTGTSVAATWTGGIAGATFGSLTFGTIGFVIGLPFGPIGSLVGSSVLSICGIVIGGIGGGCGADSLAKSALNYYMPEEDSKKK